MLLIILCGSRLNPSEMMRLQCKAKQPRRVTWTPVQPSSGGGGIDEDLGQDRSGGQNRSGGSEKLAQSSGSVEDRSGGRSRDVSPTPSGGSAWSRVPGDSEVSFGEEEANAREKGPAGPDTAPLPFAGRRPRGTAPPAVAGEVSQGCRLKCSLERPLGCRQYLLFLRKLG